MSNKGDTIYKRSRLEADITLEEAAMRLHVSVRQLTRYESSLPDEHTEPQPDVVASMIEVYDDLYLGYLYLLKNPVGKALLPRNVEKGDLLRSVVKLGIASSRYTSIALELQAAALDGVIEGEEETELWKQAMEPMNLMAAAILEAQVAKRNKPRRIS